MSLATHKGYILIVDDTLTNLQILEKIRGNSGYVVRGIPDGALALMSALETPPEA